MRLAYHPTGPLASYVEQLWYCDGHGLVHRKARVLPTGRFQLFFSLSDAPIGGAGAANWKVGRGAAALVVGIEAHGIVVETSTLQSAMGVLFCPAGARAFFDEPADVFYDQRVSLDLIWGSRAATVRDRLREASAPAEKFRLLEEALLARLDRRRELHVGVLYGLTQFARVPHIRSVFDVAREASLSRRRFAQLFREQVGITPKLYCQLRRFQSVLQQISFAAPVDWADVALASGYCDQAHLANEFRRFSGVSPSAYRASDRL